MNVYFSFFDAHIKPLFRNDTNARIDGILIALAYPQVFLIGPEPSTSNAVVDVEKTGIDIAPDKYPLYRFLHENPETCKTIIYSHAGLKQYFVDWFSQQ